MGLTLIFRHKHKSVLEAYSYQYDKTCDAILPMFAPYGLIQKISTNQKLLLENLKEVKLLKP